MTIKQYCYYKAPFGELLLVRTKKGLEELHFPNYHKANTPRAEWVNAPLFFKDVIQQLKEYFMGKRKEFTIPLNPTGTSFQMRVWSELQKIPFGTTSSYLDIAKRIHNPKACRAVGGANNKNPISIIIPCHRIIGKDGSLTGFGGGLEVKEFLLNHEKEYL